MARRGRPRVTGLLPPPLGPGRPRPRREQTEVRAWRIVAGTAAARWIFTGLIAATAPACALGADAVSGAYGIAGLALGVPMAAVLLRAAGLALVWAVIVACAAIAGLGALLDGSFAIYMLEQQGALVDGGQIREAPSGPRHCEGALTVAEGAVTEAGRRQILIVEPLRHVLAALPAAAIGWWIAFGPRAELVNPRLRVP